MAGEQQTDRMKALDDWLERVNARRLWSVGPHHTGPNASLTAYQINGHVVLIQRFGKVSGWEIYVPATESNKVEDALLAASQFCGLTTTSPPAMTIYPPGAAEGK